jgi:hypothetical protein
MNKKICTKCKIEKEYSEFHFAAKGIGGVRSVCKSCRSIEKTEYLSRDYVKIKSHDNYIKNFDSIRKRTALHYWTLNGQYHQYKKSAKKRGLEFPLKEIDCIPFYNTDCFYCGDKINGLGIDRLDNSVGYISTNIVPCCKSCNFMKHVKSKDEFIEHLKKIITNLKL